MPIALDDSSEPPRFRSFLRLVSVTVGVTMVATLGLIDPAQADDQNSETVTAIEQAVEDVGQVPAAENEAVSLPTDGDDGVTLTGTNGTLEFDVPATGDVEETTDAGVLLAGSADDTNIAVESTDIGVRALIHIGAEDASERFEFAVHGDAVKLVLSADGSVDALNDVGDIIATAMPPWAVDAAGREVPTHYEISGTTVVQVVEHRDGDFEYGVTADPAWAAIFAVAAKVCAGGALTSVAGTALVDIYHGKASNKKAYVENAVASCIVSAGGWPIAVAMKSKTVRKWAVTQVIKLILQIRRW